MLRHPPQIRLELVEFQNLPNSGIDTHPNSTRIGRMLEFAYIHSRALTGPQNSTRIGRILEFAVVLALQA